MDDAIKIPPNLKREKKRKKNSTLFFVPVQEVLRK